MSKAIEVLSILRGDYNWPLGVAPEPNAVEADPRAASEIARAIDDWCYAQKAPPSYPGSDYEWARYHWFNERKEYWGITTQIALGTLVELPEDKIREAKSVSEFRENLALLRDQYGYKLCSQEEYDKRAVKAALVPPEWLAAGCGDIYQLAVLRGTIPVGLKGFEIAYAQCSPTLRSVRGLDAQQWMENEAATKHGRLVPWLPGGNPNPAVKP